MWKKMEELKAAAKAKAEEAAAKAKAAMEDAKVTAQAKMSGQTKEDIMEAKMRAEAEKAGLLHRRLRQRPLRQWMPPPPLPPPRTKMRTTTSDHASDRIPWRCGGGARWECTLTRGSRVRGNANDRTHARHACRDAKRYALLDIIALEYV